MKKKEKNKFIIILISLLFFYLVFFLEMNTNNNYLNPLNIIKDLVAYPLKIITAALNYREDKKIDTAALEKYSNEELNKELKELKDLLQIQNYLSGFKTINATVLSRNKNYWFNTLSLDKGTADGVNLDMAVVGSKGLIGKIDKVTKTTSQVKMISNNDINNKISVVISINNNNVYGLINGYLDSTNLLMVTTTDKIIEIPKGTVVKTSGMGGVFPSSIIVGKVKEITKDKYDVGRIIKVTPEMDLSTIRFVAILKRVTND